MLKRMHLRRAIKLVLGSSLVQVLDLRLMGKRHWQVTECSAISGKGLQLAFDWLVDDVKNRIYLLG